jgi:HK97 gp10 family phage protein
MFRVKIAGLSELQAETEKLAKELREAEQPSAMAAGEVIREAWAGLVPVLDGNYRDSLAVVWLGKQGAAVGISWVGGLAREDQPVMYGKRLEFGDSIIPAQPSARPAVESSRAEALEAGAEPLRSVVRGRRARTPRIPA